MDNLLNSLLNSVSNSFSDIFFDPAARTFYGYLLSALLLAFVWAKLAWPTRQQSFKRLFTRQYWCNRSSYQDMTIIVINRLLFLILGLSWVFFTIEIANQTLGFFKFFAEPWQRTSHLTSSIALYSALLFLMDDASRFALHRLMHKFDFLWRIHQVHHSASTLTPLTVMRLHPIESFLYQARAAFVHGVCAGGAFYFLGFQPQDWQIWGVAVWVIAFNTFGANLRHSPIAFSFGKFEKIFISPAQHQGHHGLNSMNTNYGAVLAIWDRMFKSWREGKKENPLPKVTTGLWAQLTLQKINWK